MSDRRPEIDWSGGQQDDEPDMVDKLTMLAEAMKGTSVTEIELRDGDHLLHLRRQAQASAPSAASTLPQLPVSSSAPIVTEPAAAEETAVSVTEDLAGVFYISPTPTSPPFVQVGDTVAVGQIVCIIEAMKVFNEVKTKVGGVVVAIPPKNGQLVKKGDPLVRIRPF